MILEYFDDVQSNECLQAGEGVQVNSCNLCLTRNVLKWFEGALPAGTSKQYLDSGPIRFIPLHAMDRV